MKWTGLFLSERAYTALDQAQQIACMIPLGNLAEVDVGIVTGCNKFFLLSEQTCNELSLFPFTTPVIGRTSALKSLFFDEQSFINYRAKEPSFLLSLANVPTDRFSDNLMKYLLNGESAKAHSGYKCRTRKRWFDVPSIYVPDGFLYRQIHKYPLMVVNNARVTCTDTIHRVRFKDGVIPELLAASCFNSLTLAWAEVCGRSYGGGVLELEPREAEQLPVPYNAAIHIDIEKLDTLLCQGRDIEALDYVDKIVLADFAGFDQITIRDIRSAWIELRERRTNRR